MTENAAPKQRRGPGKPFEPGKSGNPAGKPPGTRHKATRLAEQLMEGDIENVVSTVLQAARNGDMTAARIVLERVAPVRRGRPVAIDIPAGSDSQTIADAYSVVLRAMGEGELSPEEAAALGSVLEGRRKSIETAELEQRIAALEEKKQ